MPAPTRFPLITRQLPHNLDAEMAVLGGMLLDNHVRSVTPWLSEQHFVLASHQTIFRAIVRTIDSGRRADVVTMKELFTSDDGLDQEGGVDYLVRLADCAASPINAGEYARILVELYIRREMIDAGHLMEDTGYKPNGASPPEHLLKTISRLEDLRAAIPAPTTAALEAISSVSAKEFVTVQELVPGLVCPGLTLLCAKPKVGKSWMLLEFGMAIAEGGLALGQLRCLKAETILIMLEDSQRRIADRSRVLRPDGRPDGCWLATDWPKGALGIARLDATLDAYPEVQMVGIDVLAAFRDPVGNGGGYQADYDAVAGLQKLAQRRGIAIVLLHHLRKADGDDPIDLVSGTLGITAAADHVIVITGNAELGYKLTMRGRDIPEVSWDLAFDRGSWSVLGDSAPKRKRLDAVETIERDNQIRSLLDKGHSQKDIAKALGCGTATICRVAAKMASDAKNA